MPAAPVRHPTAIRVRGTYDAAQTTPQNYKHWAHADLLSAAASNNPEVRRIIRSRARYEGANNGYARGLIRTLANYVVGGGPRLQVTTEDSATNRLLEREFTRWMKASRFAHKLRLMRMTQCESGECFAMHTTNPRLRTPVKFDVRVIEPDLVEDPTLTSVFDASMVDGVRFDEWGNPASYRVLRRHPGDGVLLPIAGVTFDDVDAARVIHLFAAERPGQVRGVSEMTSSLSLFAMLRRYTLATLAAAETAANMAAMLESDAPPDGDPEDLSSGEWDEIHIEQNTISALPRGYRLRQMEAEQPTTTYPDYKREIVSEIGRPVHMPSNVISGDSSRHNYASGRLDNQAFFKAVAIDQQFVGDVVATPTFEAWFDEAVRIEGYLPQRLRRVGVSIPHQWGWDGIEDADRLKSATADSLLVREGLMSLATYYSRQNRDWEQELEQMAAERALMQSLGLTPSQATAGARLEDLIPAMARESDA